MDTTMVLMTMTVCFTLIICMSMYLSSGKYAVNQWKGKFLTQAREIKAYEKSIKKQMNDVQKQALLKSLNIPPELEEPLLDFLGDFGIPEGAVQALMSNPQLIQGLLSKVSSNEDSTQSSV